MHCAGCVGKVERALRAVDGVAEASVNLATERATVAFDSARVDFDGLQAAVARAGYELAPAPAATPPAGVESLESRRAQRALGIKVGVGALLAAFVMVGGMPEVFPWAPAWLRDPWVLLALTTPVVLWVGAQFHLGLLHDVRYQSASMSSLVSIGTGAAYLFSL